MTIELIETESEFATDAETEAAEAIHGSDVVEINAPAKVSRADNGFWVQAWVWVGA